MSVVPEECLYFMRHEGLQLRDSRTARTNMYAFKTHSAAVLCRCERGAKEQKIERMDGRCLSLIRRPAKRNGAEGHAVSLHRLPPPAPCR